MLCCQINPVAYCLRCKIKGCEDHRFGLEELTCPKGYKLPFPDANGDTMLFVYHAMVDSTAKRYG